jgi:hypothetical protein
MDITMAQRAFDRPVPRRKNPPRGGAVTRLHDRAVRASIRDIAGTLQDLLSRRVTAYIVGVKDAKTINRWANGEIDVIRDSAVERRLRTAFEISTMLLAVDAPQTVKAWFVSLNPHLDDLTPAAAIREGRERDALNAARAFIANG